MRLDVEYGAIEDFDQYLDAHPRKAREAARIALNDVGGGEGLAMLRSRVGQQVNFPAGYLNDDRLGVTRRASDGNLQVEITGRQRATSLARFAAGQTVASTRRKGVRVSVKPGSARTIERGWLVQLRRGNADGGNLGLAIRLKEGERLRNKRVVETINLDTNVYLLYGPSVDQVFRDVAIDAAPELLRQVEQEFFRQYFRLVK